MTTLRNFRFLRTLLALCVLAAGFSVTGCVHRIGIQQGNFLDREDIDRVEVGMTRVQVRALLGTPMIADPFHQARWDYYFYLKRGRWKNARHRHFIVYFDGEDKVERIERRGPDTQTTTPDDEAEQDEQVEQQRTADGGE